MILSRADDFSQLTEENDRSFGIATGTLSGWVSAAKPTYTMVNSSAAALVTVKGSYAGQATGEFRLLFSANGALKCSFDFRWSGATIEPRQIGVVFDLVRKNACFEPIFSQKSSIYQDRLGTNIGNVEKKRRCLQPKSVDWLSWHRRGQFSYYSETDIGRNDGFDVQPKPCDTFFGFSGDACGYSPGTLWADDTTPAGSNDFRSTRDALLWYSLCAQPAQKQCIRLVGNGKKTHICCAVLD